MENKVILLDCWASSFAMRAKIALEEKQIEYKIKEEDLSNKSEMLLKMNPIHQKIPVLIHNEKPICESLNIVEYIDETWYHKSPILPSDPYMRSQSRLSTDYIDKHLYSLGKRVWAGKGEDQEEAKKELIKVLRTLEEELGDKPYFGGNDKIGYVDVALVPFTSWFYTFETFGNFNIGAECPKIIAWANRCLQIQSVAKALPHPLKIFEFASNLKKKFGDHLIPQKKT